MIGRAILVVLDSVGIGGAPDASRYDDYGANTLLHVRGWCQQHGSGLPLPTLGHLGLWEALSFSDERAGVSPSPGGSACWGIGTPTSPGKDSTSGHWEIACAPPERDFTYFPRTVPFLAPNTLDTFVRLCAVPAFIGNCHGSGTALISRFGKLHVETGMPILYTSADSVLQVAAHETMFGLARLNDVCQKMRAACDHLNLNVARVIARPFEGHDGHFTRTGNRVDISMPPEHQTLLDCIVASGREVVGVGKVVDLFGGRGFTQQHKVTGIKETVRQASSLLDGLEDGGLLFANVVEFDSEYGHRRDPSGYARALEDVDAELSALLTHLRERDLLIITADHGNDPTWTGTDHTREQVPILVKLRGTKPGSFGKKNFCDIGATIAAHLGIQPPEHGRSFYAQLHN